MLHWAGSKHIKLFTCHVCGAIAANCNSVQGPLGFMLTWVSDSWNRGVECGDKAAQDHSKESHLPPTLSSHPDFAVIDTRLVYSPMTPTCIHIAVFVAYW